MRFRKRIIDINIDLHINTRPLDPRVIEEYAEAMAQYGEDKWQSAWREMPKITHDLDLFSGFHTVYAAMNVFGDEHEINFDVQGNTLRDAFFLATEQNAQHGRRRSNSEKRNIVLRWLLDNEMKEWTDGYIAEQCQVSQNFVTSVSNQLKSDLSGIDFPTSVFSDGKRKSITEYHRPSKRKFLGKGGVQWMETDKIGAEQTKAAQQIQVDKAKKKESELDGMDDFGASKLIEANKQDPEYIEVYEEAVKAAEAAKDTYNAVKKELGFTGLPWDRPNQPIHEKKCFRAYAIVEGQMLTLVNPAFDTSIDFQKRLVTVWQTLKQDLETPAEWVKTAAWQYRASLLEDEEEVDDAELESETQDFEHKNAYDFAIAKCDEAIRTYEEKQESLGLSALNWYGADGFFYYAQAELERQGKKLGYANHTDTITQLSEKAKLWESVTTAIKHKANWVKAIAGEEERKAERERQEAIKECRKLVKETKRRFHEVREPLGFPDLEWEHFISTYAQKQFEDPLFPHALENAPLDKLKDRCGVWVAIKSALSAARPLAWVEEIAELHNKAKAEEQAQREMIEAYENGQAAFEAHPLAKLIDFEYFMIEAGDYLDGDELEDPQFVHHSDAEAYKELWEGVTETLKQNKGWVKEQLEKFSDEDTEEAEYHISHKEALSKAINAMNQAEQDYAACQSKLGLGELPWRSHIGPCFWNYAQDAFGVTGIEDGQLPILVEPSDSDRIERLIELRTLWNRVQLAIKMPGDWVKALKPDIDGLKAAMRKRINDLHGFVGGGTTLAKLYHTTPKKVIEVRDLILAESKQEERIDDPEEDPALHNERALCAGHIAGAEHDFNQLKQKHGLKATFQDFYVYACEHFEEQRNLDLSRYIDGLRSTERIRQLLEMWQGIIADIGAEADWIQDFVNQFKTTEPEQPTALQIEPLGPSDANVEAESELSKIASFEQLERPTKADIRILAGACNRLLLRDDAPEALKVTTSDLLNAIKAFVGTAADTDEQLKYALSVEESAGIVKRGK